MTTIMWPKDAAGNTHGYAVSGVVGKHLPSMEAVNLLKFLGCKEVTNVPAHWRDSIALLDGPCKNVS